MPYFGILEFRTIDEVINAFNHPPKPFPINYLLNLDRLLLGPRTGEDLLAIFNSFPPIVTRVRIDFFNFSMHGVKLETILQAIPPSVRELVLSLSDYPYTSCNKDINDVGLLISHLPLTVTKLTLKWTEHNSYARDQQFLRGDIFGPLIQLHEQYQSFSLNVLTHVLSFLEFKPIHSSTVQNILNKRHLERQQHALSFFQAGTTLIPNATTEINTPDTEEQKKSQCSI
jgi:hypothetical protein